jgi:plastocyanin
LIATATLTSPACGGGGSPASPATPVPLPSANVTITITTAGVDRTQVEVPVGGRVAFVNNDTSFHEMSSDPHPVHTDCPPLNQVGALSPGRTGVTGPMTVARTCSFHDHGEPTNANLQGRIVVR